MASYRPGTVIILRPGGPTDSEGRARWGYFLPARYVADDGSNHRVVVTCRHAAADWRIAALQLRPVIYLGYGPGATTR